MTNEQAIEVTRELRAIGACAATIRVGEAGWQAAEADCLRRAHAVMRSVAVHSDDPGDARVAGWLAGHIGEAAVRMEDMARGAAETAPDLAVDA